MGWGGDEYHGKAAHGSADYDLSTRRRNMILLITSDEKSRDFCTKLASEPTLLMQDVHVAHEASHETILEKSARSAVVVIATCRASLDKGSSAHEREKIAADAAIAANARIVILSGQNHEAAQDHLANARGTRPLVVVPVHNDSFGEGFMDCFPLRTEFLERNDSPELTRVLARKLLERVV